MDGAHYSVPIRHAYRPAWVKLYHDRVEVAVADEVVAKHAHSFRQGAKVLEPLHVLPLLERKHRAVGEATALQGWELPEAFGELRRQLHQCTRKPDRGMGEGAAAVGGARAARGGSRGPGGATEADRGGQLLDGRAC